MLNKILALALAATVSLTAVADEASVKKAVEAKLGSKVTSVSKSPYLGLYEVYTEGQILYTDEKLTAIIAGTLIDGATMKNITAERLQKLTAIKFSELPLELAFKRVHGDGKRVLATFEDPNCGYCKKLIHSRSQSRSGVPPTRSRSGMTGCLMARRHQVRVTATQVLFKRRLNLVAS